MTPVGLNYITTGPTSKLQLRLSLSTPARVLRYGAWHLSCSATLWKQIL